MAGNLVGTRLIAKLAPNSSVEVEALKAQIKELQTSNTQLQEMLHATQTGRVTMRGYLNRWRDVNSVIGLFTQEWEMRWFCLCGTVIRYYKTERDSAFSPRGIVDVSNCIVEIQEYDASLHWSFRIVEAGGKQLLWLATDNQSVADAWADALRRAGLRIVKPGQRLARGSGGVEPSMPSQAQQDRWEVSSADSELPELPHQGSSLPRLRRPPRPPQLAHHVSRDSTRDSAASDSAVHSPSAHSAAGDDSSVISTPREVGEAAAARRHHQRPPMTGSTPVHTASKNSYLSPAGRTLWASKHDGLLNLAFVILFATNIRLVLENLLKYGLRLNLIGWVARSWSGQGNLQLLMCFPALLALAFCSLGAEVLGMKFLQAEADYVEKQQKRDAGQGKEFERQLSRMVKRHERAVWIAQFIITTVALVMPCGLILMSESEILPSFVLAMLAIIVWMKLVSYWHANYDLRNTLRRQQGRLGRLRHVHDTDSSWGHVWVEYPDNLTCGNMAYYLAVPTLTYQLNYPRSHRIRKRWLVMQLLELAFFAGLGLFIMDQYMVPAVENSYKPMKELDWLRIFERTLKLALPNLYCWLIMFYCLFHLWLNILAEITYFGDREFYKDWWNAATLGDYWKLWNMPVHKWLLRTVYFPLLSFGWGRFNSMLAVFFVSALFHELVLGVPLRMLRFWAFAGIMLQVPLIALSEKVRKRTKSDSLGNIIFWVAFCVVGQPASVLLYAHDRAWYDRVSPVQLGANGTATANGTSVFNGIGAFNGSIAFNDSSAAYNGTTV